MGRTSTSATRLGSAWTPFGATARRHLVVAGAAAAIVVAASFPGSLSASAAAPKWQIRSVPAVSNFPLRSVACSSTGCVSLALECSVGGCGGLLPTKSFYSVNKGTSWKDAPISAAVGDATTVSCGSSLVCIATATKGPLGPHASSAIIVTQNGGKSWAIDTESKYSLSQAACGSATACVALGTLKSAPSPWTSVGIVSTNAGHTWTQAGFPAKKGYVAAMTCGTPTTCIAVGDSESSGGAAIFTSANVGKSWKLVTPPAGSFDLAGVTCDALTCASWNATQVLISKNGGKSWSRHALPAGVNFASVACFSPAQCVAVGYASTTVQFPAAEVTGNGGASWARQAMPHVDGTLSSVACEPGACVAVGTRLTYSGAMAKGEFPLTMTY